MELPADYGHPMAIVFENGELIVAWMTSSEAVNEWASVLQPYATERPRQSNFIISCHENIFTSILYRVMKRKSQVQEEESKVPEVVEVPDEITGWLQRTSGKQVSERDEPFLYRFFHFDLVSGILSEYNSQNQNKQKQAEYQLKRCIVHVETNLSNELRQGHEVFFRRHAGNLPSNFSVPLDRSRAIVLHLIDGDILFLWASVK